MFFAYFKRNLQYLFIRNIRCIELVDEESIILSVLYSTLSDEMGPETKAAIPTDLSDNIRMLVAIRVITLLSGEEAFLPKKLVMVPFPSLNAKSLIKYIEWNDPTRRGGLGRAAIVLLFKELDDVVFYKYMNDLEALYKSAADQLIQLELEKKEMVEFTDTLQKFKAAVSEKLEEFRTSELTAKQKEAFPEAEQKSFDYRLKTIVIGDPSVGKTSLILRFTYNAFTRTYLPTIGTNITEKIVQVGKDKAQIIVWDIAGQSKFETMRKHFYAGLDGALIVFDLTHEKSFSSVPNWYQDVKKNYNKNTPLIAYLIGNKSDLTSERKVKKEDALRVASELGLDYIETSALSGENVNDVFHKIAERVLKSQRK